MSVEDYIKFTFDEPHAVLRAHITKEALAALGDDPGKFVGGARLKMASLLEGESFSNFIIHEKRFAEAWAALQRHPEKAPVDLQIASGLPVINNCELSINLGQPGVTFAFNGKPDDMASVKPRWLLTYLQDKADSLSRPVSLNPSDVHCAWYRIVKNRIHPLKMNLSPAPEQSTTAGKKYLIKQRKDIGRVEVLFDHYRSLSEEEFSKINLEVFKMTSELAMRSGESGYFCCFEKNIHSTYQLLKTGYYKLGIGFPASVLAGVTHRTQDDSPAAPVRDAIWVLNGGEQSQLKGVKQCMDEAKGLLAADGLQSYGSEKLVEINRNPEKPFSISSKAYHESVVTYAGEALSALPSTERDFESLTIAIDESSAKKIIAYLKDLARELPARETAGTEADAMSIQFFPLTRIKIDENDPPSFSIVGRNEIWQKLVLRELIGLDTFRNDHKWVRGKLLFPVTEEELMTSIDYLKTSKFIFADPSKGGKLCQTQKNILTGDNTSNISLAEYHRIMLDASKQAMDPPYSERSSFVNCLYLSNENHRKIVIRYVKDFLSNLFEETGQAMIPDQLYHLGLQNFPLLKK